MYGPWVLVYWYGDKHVVPMADDRAHTWPMCWCDPKRENVNSDVGWAGSVIFAHNACSDRFVK